jgi:hypothetical protein
MAKRKKEFGRIELPKGKTVNERAKNAAQPAVLAQINGTTLDASDVATILAALRLFQSTYEDKDAVQIADVWPMHFNVRSDSGTRESGEELEVVPEPLGTADIDELCERINFAKALTIL